MKINYVFILMFVSQIVFAQTCNNNISSTTPTNDFIVDNDEVTDIRTNLIWQKCPLGFTGENCSDYTGEPFLYTWKEALQASRKWYSTNKKWRLPNIKELRSIVEEQCYEPAINFKIFSSFFLGNTWSSTPSTIPEFSDRRWYVGFDQGRAGYVSGTYTMSVRLVRSND